MNARERWQALQARLTAAKAFAEAGDRKTALREIDAALELDPDFLAAHSLRERLLSERDRPVPAPPPVAPAGAAAKSADGYALFEQRARRRRVDRKVEAARTAMAKRRIKDAAAALDEIIEIDRNLPELAALTAQFDDLRRVTATPRRGPWIVAAASFAAVVLGATWLEHAHPSLAAHPTSTVAALVESPAPASVVDQPPLAVDAPRAIEPSSEPIAAPTTGVRASDEPARQPETPAVELSTPTPTDRLARAVETRPALQPRAPVAAPAATEPTPPVHASEPIPMPTQPPANTASNAVGNGIPIADPVPAVDRAAVPVTVNDEQLVKQALQRYRTAYDGLDAPSARAVYPAVNEAALARAFDGLQSQALTFDSCDVQVRGDVADATCRGSAKYVPKVGSREPRTEPRTWTFALRRNGNDWKIQSARAQR